MFRQTLSYTMQQSRIFSCSQRGTEDAAPCSFALALAAFLTKSAVTEPVAYCVAPVFSQFHLSKIPLANSMLLLTAVGWVCLRKSCCTDQAKQPCTARPKVKTSWNRSSETNNFV